VGTLAGSTTVAPEPPLQRENSKVESNASRICKSLLDGHVRHHEQPHPACLYL